VSVDDVNTYTDYYSSISGGSIVVDVNGSQITASVTNVTVINGASNTKIVTGTLTAY
jgi:hypothetical protein